MGVAVGVAVGPYQFDPVRSISMLAVTPYIDQPELLAAWKRYARGAFPIDIRAVGIRCARYWPGRKARPGETQAQFEKRKRRSMVFLLLFLGSVRIAVTGLLCQMRRLPGRVPKRRSSTLQRNW